jgi:transposase
MEGSSVRRSWTYGEKAAIVAESFAAGAKVSAVARRHGLKPQHLAGWRRLAREGRLVVLQKDAAHFAPVIVAEALPPAAYPEAAGAAHYGFIEIAAGDISVRLAPDICCHRLAGIVQALRRSAP